MELITITTSRCQELVDITPQLRKLINASGIKEGVCHLWCRHTTAALTVNENADPDVKEDLLMALQRMVADDWPYRHAEGNSPAHVKSSLVGCQLTVPIANGGPDLGTWQGVLFAEFDGPRRNRQICVKVIPSC